MNRQVDHQTEVEQGLNLGLWTTEEGSSNPEWADEKKDSWTVFKYMDTAYSEEATAGARSVLGVSSWEELIPSYSESLYNKTSLSRTTLCRTKNYTPSASLPSAWTLYGAGSRISGRSALTVTHDASRNKNSLWGFSQNFDAPSTLPTRRFSIPR